MADITYPGGELLVDVKVDGAIAHVRVVGDVDVITAAGLRDRMAELVPDGVSRFVVDASGIGFLDSSGLNALVRLIQLAEGIQVTLVDPSPFVERVLDVTGLADLFIEPADPT